MPYLLIEDGFADNEKIVGLSDKAFRLHMSALVYCARNLTDGAISELALRSAGANSQLLRPKTVVKELLSARLWTENGTGWKIHDYLKHNPSRVEMEKKREAARERKRRQREHPSQGASRGTSRDRHATQDPLQGVSKETPPGSKPYGLPGVTRDKALAEAQAIAKTWNTPDSDAFAKRLDELQTEHRITLGALEREHLWDIASTTINGHTKRPQPLDVQALLAATPEPDRIKPPADFLALVRQPGVPSLPPRLPSRPRVPRPSDPQKETP